MNKRIRPATLRAQAATWLKTAGFGFVAITGMVLLIPLGLWFAAQQLTVRRARSPSKKTFARSTPS